MTKLPFQELWVSHLKASGHSWGKALETSTECLWVTASKTSVGGYPLTTWWASPDVCWVKASPAFN